MYISWSSIFAVIVVLGPMLWVGYQDKIEERRRKTEEEYQRYIRENP